jgi:hypothetical protein
MGLRENASLRRSYPFICMLVALTLGSCVEGHKDLLSFLQDGTTTKGEVETRFRNLADLRGDNSPTVWGNGRIWTYRVGKGTEGFYIYPGNDEWSGSDHYSLVREFGPNGVLRRHALIDVKPQP